MSPQGKASTIIKSKHEKRCILLKGAPFPYLRDGALLRSIAENRRYKKLDTVTPCHYIDFCNDMVSSREGPMPKSTFFNLPPEKQKCIRRALIFEFETHPLAEASIKHIVETLSIARGSFYQYFEDLTESYFYILEQETTELHTLFAKLMQESDDVGSALDAFGPRVAEELFDPLLILLW